MSEEKTAVETKKDAPKADISFEVGYGKDKTRFDLRMISVSEELEIQNQFNDLSDISDEAEKAEREYQICLKALVRFSAGNQVYPKLNTFDIKSERIIRRAFLMFKQGLEPESSFL